MNLRATARWWVHNVIAHPLLVLFPPIGYWLHDRTTPDHETETRP
jgi:hypothetical protein